MGYLIAVFASIIALRGVAGSDYIIHNASELIEFSNLVNSGKNSFAGTTVFLDNDIYFPVNSQEASQEFHPIGKTNNKQQFRGTFDGQGHVILNLDLKSSEQYMGLFG